MLGFLRLCSHTALEIVGTQRRVLVQQRFLLLGALCVLGRRARLAQPTRKLKQLLLRGVAMVVITLGISREEKLESRQRHSLVRVTQRVAAIRTSGAVHAPNQQRIRLVFLFESLPVRRQLLAMATPRRVEFYKRRNVTRPMDQSVEVVAVKLVDRRRHERKHGQTRRGAPRHGRGLLLPHRTACVHTAIMKPSLDLGHPFILDTDEGC